MSAKSPPCREIKTTMPGTSDPRIRCFAAGRTAGRKGATSTATDHRERARTRSGTSESITDDQHLAACCQLRLRGRWPAATSLGRSVSMWRRWPPGAPIRITVRWCQSQAAEVTFLSRALKTPTLREAIASPGRMRSTRWPTASNSVVPELVMAGCGTSVRRCAGRAGIGGLFLLGGVMAPD
jgi:hypothetical protein